MTDREAIVTILRASNIKFEEDIGGGIQIHDGYDGFYSVFDFNDNGKLTRVSAWE